MVFKPREDISIVFSGQAGQGLQTLEALLTRMLKRSGYNVFSYSEYMSRIRGGNNSTQVRVSSRRVTAYTRRIDLFVPLHENAMERFHDRITQETVILGDRDFIEERYLDGHHPVLEVPINEIAREKGGAVYANTVLLGILAGLFYVDSDLMHNEIRMILSGLGEDRLRKNLDASGEGYERSKKLLKPGQAAVSIERTAEVRDEILTDGINAVGLGGLAGGCTFVSSYPMSPSTGVLVFFTKKAESSGVVVEQTEDEISAVNMAIGSWYAGGRSLVTTSGGGYALMVEGLSLAGCIESPLVIHLGQRPGPATGLPTRTEQADLQFALYSGHGEFSRAILAPGTHEQGFSHTRHAFYLADKYQVPVFILTDQFFLERRYNLPDLDMSKMYDQRFIVQTRADYRRYALTESGISPRGIPGFGEGRVRVDSDEHDEDGFITEDFSTRTAMVNKRLKKLSGLQKEVLAPQLFGPDDYRNLVVCWGSSLHAVQEGLDMLGRDDTAILHYSQVYPLAEVTADYLERAHRKIVVESNATAQFARLIRSETGIGFDGAILKYSGLPLMPEDVCEGLNDKLGKKESTHGRV